MIFDVKNPKKVVKRWKVIPRGGWKLWKTADPNRLHG
jgi:hypothetical protein